MSTDSEAPASPTPVQRQATEPYVPAREPELPVVVSAIAEHPRRHKIQPRPPETPTLGVRLEQAPLIMQRAPMTDRVSVPAEPTVQRVEFVTPRVPAAPAAVPPAHAPSPAASSRPRTTIRFSHTAVSGCLSITRGPTFVISRRQTGPKSCRGALVGRLKTGNAHCGGGSRASTDCRGGSSAGSDCRCGSRATTPSGDSPPRLSSSGSPLRSSVQNQSRPFRHLRRSVSNRWGRQSDPGTPTPRAQTIT